MLANINQIRQLYIDSEQKIWVATRRNGLFLIDSDENIKNYNYSENSNNCISSDIVRSICEDNAGNLWIATFNGLNKYDKKELRDLIEAHVAATGSKLGTKVLDDFDYYLPHFKKLIPNEYKKMITLSAKLEEKGLNSQQAQMEAFYESIGAKH